MCKGFSKGPGLVFGLRRALAFALLRGLAFALLRALAFALLRALTVAFAFGAGHVVQVGAMWPGTEGELLWLGGLQ